MKVLRFLAGLFLIPAIVTPVLIWGDKAMLMYCFLAIFTMCVHLGFVFADGED